jgi:hypothetical protein
LPIYYFVCPTAHSFLALSSTTTNYKETFSSTSSPPTLTPPTTI